MRTLVLGPPDEIAEVVARHARGYSSRMAAQHLPVGVDVAENSLTG
ncbi:hypothetical protein KRI00_15145 [Paraburkholderia fungorum]|nr:hypothetical protein [Paraburkholderia fungorum]